MGPIYLCRPFTFIGPSLYLHGALLLPCGLFTPVWPFIEASAMQAVMAAEMKCYRRILKIRWQQKTTNTEVRSRVGSTRDIIQLIMERKLNLFVHICRMDDQRLMKNRMF